MKKIKKAKLSFSVIFKKSTTNNWQQPDLFMDCVLTKANPNHAIISNFIKCSQSKHKIM